MTVCRVYIEQENDDASESKLFITSIRQSDAGQYECRADVNGGTLTSRIRLLIYGKLTSSPRRWQYCVRLIAIT